MLDVADGQISMEDIDVQRQEKEGVVVAIDNNLGWTRRAVDEGYSNAPHASSAIVHKYAKGCRLDVADRIRIGVVGQWLESAVVLHRDYIAAETLRWR